MSPCPLCVRPADAASITLTWDPNMEQDLTGYRIYYGESSCNYVDYVEVTADEERRCTFSGLAEGNTYYFAATAYKAYNILANELASESDYSDELVYHVPLPCDWSISPTSQSFSASGGAGTVNVTTRADCPWTAVSNGFWLILTSNSSNEGSGTVNYCVANNPSISSRAGTLSVAKQTFTATQEGLRQFALTLNKTGTGSGTITTEPAGPTFVEGTVMRITATPDISSVFSGWSGGATGTMPSVSVTMLSDMTITATFTLKTYTLATTVGPNGSISPQGPVTVNHGSNQAFSITPSPCYRIEDVRIDGASSGAVSSYAFTNVTANHTIQATFVPITYALSVTKTGTGTGTVTTSPPGTILNACTVVTLTATPDVSSLFTGWSGGVTGPSATTSFAIHGDTGVTAAFTLKTYTLSATAGANGSISPQGSIVLNHGASQSFTISPDPGYHIEEVKVDGLTVGALTSYTFSNVSSNHSIEVIIGLDPPRATTLVSPSGTIFFTTPTYTWNAVPGPTRYLLKVSDSEGTKIEQWYTAAEAGCAFGTGACSVTPGTKLSAGTGTWWVQTSNPAGHGPMSSGMAFTLEYKYRMPITISSSMSGSSCSGNLSSFPVLINITNNNLRTTGNGGHVENSNGYDIIFRDSNGNKLSYEMEEYNASSGNVIAWVKIPSLSTGSSATIYLHYGSNGNTTSREDKSGLWGSSYAGVWHLKENSTSTDGVTDSTSGANHGTAKNSVSLRQSAKIGYGISCDPRVSDQYVEVKNASHFEFTSDFTVSAWMQASGWQEGGDPPHQALVSKGFKYDYPNTMSGWQIGRNGNSLKAKAGFVDTDNEYKGVESSSNVYSGWHYIVGVYTKSGSDWTVRLYKDGSSQGTDTAYGLNLTNSSTYKLAIGASTRWSGKGWNGYIDEARVSNTARTACWIETEYNNQNSPSSYLTLGAESSLAP